MCVCVCVCACVCNQITNYIIFCYSVVHFISLICYFIIVFSANVLPLQVELRGQ